MITIKFFSLIREAVEVEGLSLEWSPDLSSVAMVKAELSQRGACLLYTSDAADE